MRLEPILEQVDDPGASDGRGNEEIGSIAEVADEGAGGIDVQNFSVALELPRDERAAREANAQARVIEQSTRVARASTPFEIGGRRVLGYTGISGEFVIEPGPVEGSAGSSSSDIRSRATFTVTGPARVIPPEDRAFISVAKVGA